MTREILLRLIGSAAALAWFAVGLREFFAARQDDQTRNAVAIERAIAEANYD